MMADVDTPQQQQQEPTAEVEEGGGGVSAEVAGHQVSISEKQLPLAGMFLSAIILIIAMTSAIGRSDPQYYGYGVSVGAIAMVFSFVGLVLTLGPFRDSSSAAVMYKYNNYFLVVWNFIGALILTFWGPFQGTGNGYFSAWALAVFAVMAIGITGEDIQKQFSGMGSQVGLGGCAIIVLIAVIPYLKDADKGIANVAIYGIVIAILTIPLGFGSSMFLSSPGMVKFGVFAMFAVLWIVFACFATFRGPFPNTGNGYFGSWGAAITSVFSAMAAKQTPTE